MELIDTYRQAGLPLADVARVLDAGQGTLRELLETRLKDLNSEISNLRRQQQLIVRLLAGRVAVGETRVLDKDRWVEILRATGLDDDDMHRWHIEFERLSPEAHQDFLESLGLDEEAIRRTRDWSREMAQSASDGPT
jgi:hypothetical protein